jgi:hypothetical protein
LKIAASLLRETLSHTPRTGYGAKGAVWGEAIDDIPCAAEPSHSKIINGDGAEVVASMFFCLAPGRTYQAGDRLQYEGDDYHIIRADPVKHTGRVHHWEVYAK